MTKQKGFRSILDRLEKLDARRNKHFKTEGYQNNHHHIFLKKLPQFAFISKPNVTTQNVIL